MSNWLYRCNTRLILERWLLLDERNPGLSVHDPGLNMAAQVSCTHGVHIPTRRRCGSSLYVGNLLRNMPVTALGSPYVLRIVNDFEFDAVFVGITAVNMCQPCLYQAQSCMADVAYDRCLSAKAVGLL